MKLSSTGIPGIYTRTDGRGRTRYCWSILHHGKAVRRASRRNTLRGAMAERDRALERVAHGLPVDEMPEAPAYTVRKAARDYLKACEGLRSYRRYSDHGRNLERLFGDLSVCDLSQVALAGYRKKRSEEGMSAATINRDLSFLRAACNYAQAENGIGEHYFSRLRKKADRRKVFAAETPSAGLRRISNQEFSRVLSFLPGYLQPIPQLLLATGMRTGEALGLRWEQVRGPDLYLSRTKSGKPRQVPLTPEAARLLPKRPTDAADDQLVFRGPDDGDLRNNVQRAWRKARTLAGLPWLRLHDLRHEAASRYLESGGDLRALQVLGGWSDLRLVERYSKVSLDRIRETLARMLLPPVENPSQVHAEYTGAKSGLRHTG